MEPRSGRAALDLYPRFNPTRKLFAKVGLKVIGGIRREKDLNKSFRKRESRGFVMLSCTNAQGIRALKAPRLYPTDGV